MEEITSDNTHSDTPSLSVPPPSKKTRAIQKEARTLAPSAAHLHVLSILLQAEQQLSRIANESAVAVYDNISSLRCSYLYVPRRYTLSDSVCLSGIGLEFMSRSARNREPHWSGTVCPSRSWRTLRPFCRFKNGR